jgi:primosomal protein N' (replication factor Y)
VKRLESLGLVAVDAAEQAVDPFFQDRVPRDTPPEPTGAQHLAIEAILEAIEAALTRSFLLHGVTGSGKTEVYMRAIEACQERDRGALVLVPEIALTPQLVGRFRARFGDAVAVVHSGLSDRARYEMWKALREDRLRVAIGARSAIFAPVPRLGLVVVDEEHDGSFKQEEGVRYHARDMALLRAHRAGAVCVLGSATPILESEALVRQGKLIRLSLPSRATSASLPDVELVDLRRTGAGPSGHALLSLPLHRAIERALAAGEQAILFLNRRGFAPSIQCEACGDIVQCPTCSVSTTLHRTGGLRLRCHYCDYETPLPESCPSCGCERLAMIGLGTERLEEILEMAFPSARVARLDRDVAPGIRSEAVIDKMRRKQADILVGTQMVTKGHDLPDVTVVGVINADAALSLPDFRAAERTFQILVQVAGRAGRAQRPGRVIVQTRIPEHAVLQHAKNHDVLSFVEHELSNRREAGYPPYARLALVRLDSADENRVRQEAERLAVIARAQPASQSGEVDVLGPSPAPIERLRGRYRFRLLLRGKNRPEVRAVARAVARARDGLDRMVRMSIDIDPMHMM